MIIQCHYGSQATHAFLGMLPLYFKGKNTPSKVLGVSTKTARWHKMSLLSFMVTCVSLLLLNKMDIFIFSVGHLVQHSTFFLSDIYKKMSDCPTGPRNFDSTAFLAHLSRRLEWAIVIAQCPSSVHRPSVVVRKLSHFRLLLWNRWTEFNETWQEARSQRPLPSLCFSGRSEKQDGRPGLWLAETFSTSPLKPLNGIQRNLTGSKISTPSTKFVFFGPIGKTRWPPWPLIGWDIFDFSSETAEQNSTKLDRKPDLNTLYQVCVFRTDRKNKMAALDSDWLRHYPLLLWNRWTEFNGTW